MGTSLAIDRKTGQRRVVLAYEILFLFFGNGIVHWDVMNDIFQSLMTCTLIIKEVLPKYSDSYIFNWHSKFTNCLTWPKVDVLPQTFFLIYQILHLIYLKFFLEVSESFQNIYRFSCKIFFSKCLQNFMKTYEKFLKNKKNLQEFQKFPQSFL